MSISSPFGESLVVSRHHNISLDSTGGLSALRDIITTVGTATVTNSSGLHVLATTGPNDAAILETAETGDHQGSNAYMVSLGIKMASLPTGQQAALWGYYSGTSGYGFGVDATGYFVFTRSAGFDTRVYQNNWLSDPDPAGGSLPPMFNLGTGAIFGITASWYGEVEFTTSLPNQNGDLEEVVLHRINNNFPIVDNPNCPIRVECYNGATAASLVVQVGTRDFSVLRNENTQSRYVSHLQEGIQFTPAFSPILSIRRKVDVPFSNVSGRLLSIDTSCTTSVLFRLVRNATLNSPVWVPPNYALQTETIAEVDASATSVSSTDLVVHQWIAQPGIQREILPSYLQFVRTQPYTILIKSLFGSGGCAVNLRWSEEW